MSKVAKIIISIFTFPLVIALGIVLGVIVGIPLIAIYTCDIVLGHIWGYSNGKDDD